MYNKKAILFSLLLALVVTVWKKQEKEHFSLQTPSSEWRQFKRDDKGKLTARTPTITEAKDLKLMPHKQDLAKAQATPDLPQRLPASVENKKQVHFWDINNNDPNAKKELNELNFINKYNAEWMKLLASDLLRFQDKSTEVYIYPEKSVVKIVENNQAMFLEEVIVTFKTKDGPRSFQALINSENGKVIQTWGRTHYDRFQRRTPSAERTGLTPDGSL